MTGPAILDRAAVVARLNAAVAAKRAVPQIEDEWRAAIRAALAVGVPAVDVAEAAGCSVARVYQVRDGRR